MKLFCIGWSSIRGGPSSTVCPSLFFVTMDRRLLLLIESECTFIDSNIVPASSSQSPMSKSLSSTSSNFGCLMSSDYHSMVSNCIASSYSFCMSFWFAEVYRNVAMFYVKGCAWMKSAFARSPFSYCNARAFTSLPLPLPLELNPRGARRTSQVCNFLSASSEKLKSAIFRAYYNFSFESACHFIWASELRWLTPGNPSI